MHGSKWLGYLEVSRCGTRGNFEGSMVHKQRSTKAKESTLSLKPRSPQQASVAPQKRLLSSKEILEKKLNRQRQFYMLIGILQNDEGSMKI